MLGQVLESLVATQPGICAWCPATNLIAIAPAPSSSPTSSARVAMIEPSAPWEHFWLDAPLQDASSNGGSPDALVSLSWSPLGTRPALLTASALGMLCVWTQVPQEDTGAPHIAAINRWHGHVLCPTDSSRSVGANATRSLPLPPAPALDGMDDDEDALLLAAAAAAAAVLEEEDAPLPPAPAPALPRPPAPQGPRVVAAQWLSPPALRYWSTSGLAARLGGPQGLAGAGLGPAGVESMFAAPAPVGANHWLRRGQLVAGVVDEEGGLRVWWATLGRHPNLYQWDVSPTLNLLGVIPPPRHAGVPPAVRAASLCTSSPGCITAALITAGQPHAVTIATVHGNPLLPHIPGLELRLAPSIIIPLLSPSPSVSPLVPAAVILTQAPPAPPPLHGLPGAPAASSAGVHVYVLAGSSGRSMSGSGSSGEGTSYLLKFEAVSPGDEPAPAQVADDFLRDDDDPGLGFGPSGPTATAALTPAGEAARAVVPGAPARGGVALSSDSSKVLLLAGNELRVLDALTFELLLSQPVSQPDGAGATASASGSSGGGPLAAHAAFSPGAACVALCARTAPPPAAAQHRVAGSSAGMCVLRVAAVPESPRCALAAVQQQGPGREQATSLAAAMDAARFLWSGLSGGAMWCVAARCAAAGAVTGGEVPLATSEILDAMVHTEAQNVRPGMLHLVSRAKAVMLGAGALRGRSAACMAADLCMRGVLPTMMQALRLAVAPQDGDPGAKVPLDPASLAAVQPWLHWLPQYLSLLLSSLKAWSGARTALPTDGAGRSTHHHHHHRHHHHHHRKPHGGSAPPPGAMDIGQEDLVDFLLMDSGEAPGMGGSSELAAGAGAATGASGTAAGDGGGVSSGEPGGSGASYAVDPVELAGIAATEGASAAWAASLGRTSLRGWSWSGRGHGTGSTGGMGDGLGGVGGDAGLPSEAELEAAELPCIRLLLDYNWIKFLMYCMQLWMVVLTKAPSGADMDMDPAAQHQTLTMFKQSLQGLQGLHNLAQPKPQAQEAGGEPTPATSAAANLAPPQLASVLKSLFPGPLQLSYSRVVPITAYTQLAQLLTSPAVLAAPALTPRQILGRARELGLLTPMRDAQVHGSMEAAAVTLRTWRSSRGPTPPHAAHTALLPSPDGAGASGAATGSSAAAGARMRGSMGAGGSTAPSPLLPGATPLPGAPTPGQPAASPWGPGGDAATPGRAMGAGAAAGAAHAVRHKRARWLQQRAAALSGVPDAVGAQGLAGAAAHVGGAAAASSTGGSLAAVQAAAGGVPLLDPMSGRIVLPGSASWQYEALGGGSVALELRDAGQEARGASGAGSAGGVMATVRQHWVVACPLTGRPWKRVRALAPEHVPQVYVW